MADQDLTTSEPRETRYIRATSPVAVELHQPIAPGEVCTITGRVLGEMQVDGVLHHYRVVDGDGEMLLVPPHWIEVDDPVVTRTLEPATGEARA